MLQPESSKNWRRIEKSWTNDEEYDDWDDYGGNYVDEYYDDGGDGNGDDDDADHGKKRDTMIRGIFNIRIQ